HSGTHLFGKVYLDCNITVRGNSLLVSNYAYGTRVVYGSGTNIINAIGSSHVQLSAGTFTTAFTAPGLVTGMKLNSSTTGCSHSGAATDVINCGITLTPAHLDAAQGTAGCGSNCYFPGGAGVSNFN
ncbi:MAG TPA: hypothetical protein VKQ07_05205, partial [Jatrophihabitantaceae bacterium]|nr:hypothetical protein [Jatrophihabitantaceae bacterium]